jgi:molybdopterin-containing oxidoreductase family molybdopterin binding subunit
MHKRWNFSEVVLELAERLDMREDLYAMLNVTLGTRGTKQELDPSYRYSFEEIVDRRYKALFGEEHGLEWFKDHGVIKWPKRLEEVYWKGFLNIRVPIYFEWFLQVKEDVEKLVEELGVDDLIDTSSLKALPEWNACPSHEEVRSDYDLFATYYRMPLHTFSATYNNPWLDEASRVDPYVYTVALNAETARRKGIDEGDRVNITSAGTGETIRARVHLTEGIHPEVLVMVNAGGHWSKFTPIASAPDKGACFEWLMPLDVKYLDIPSMNFDVCAKVKVSRSEG